MNIKNLLALSISFALVGCGGGGGGGSSSSPSPSTPSITETSLPEVIEEDLNEGDQIALSSELNPSVNYDFKTYKEVTNIVYDNSVEMTTGCSIMIYKSYEEPSSGNYKVLENDLVLQSYESDCVLSGIDLTLSNNVEDIMVVYSDDSNTKYEIKNI